ncbi:MAG: hypothetical protein AB7O98_05775 [Hyphomonadaceae bacterium]
MASLSPIRDGIGAALRFVREDWRVVLTVAGIGAAAHVATLLLLGAIPILWLIGMALLSAAIHAALTRAALSGSSGVPGALPADTGRVFGAVAIVGFFFTLVAFMVAYVAMSVLIAPYAEEAKAAVDNQDAMTALLQRAVSEQPGVLFWSAIAGGAVLLLLTSRLYLAAPASVESGRIRVFESWRWTKGNLWRIVWARLALLAPALVFAGALQSLLGIVVGVGADNPLAMAERAAGNPFGFVAFYAGAHFLQISIYTALEAGLSVNLYRALKPPAA